MARDLRYAANPRDRKESSNIQCFHQVVQEGRLWGEAQKKLLWAQ